MQKLTENFHWYVITTKSRAEKKVAGALSRLGVHHYLPLHKQLRQWKDRKKWVELPLFNAYVFVFCQAKTKNEVFAVPGVVKFLTNEGRMCIISAEEIERIKKICTQEHSIKIENKKIVVGDEVEVIDGPLKGLRGRVTEKNNNSFLYVHIDNLGFTASFKIDRNIIKKKGE